MWKYRTSHQTWIKRLLSAWGNRHQNWTGVSSKKLSDICFPTSELFELNTLIKLYRYKIIVLFFPAKHQIFNRNFKIILRSTYERVLFYTQKKQFTVTFDKCLLEKRHFQIWKLCFNSQKSYRFSHPSPEKKIPGTTHVHLNIPKIATCMLPALLSRWCTSNILDY